MDAEIERLESIIHRGNAETQSLKAKSKTQSAEGAEVTSDPGLSALTERIIGAAIEVHRNLGPGLLESAYEECLCYQLSHAGLSFGIQIGLLLNFNEPVLRRGIKRLVNHFREPAPKPVTSAASAPEPQEDAMPPSSTASLKSSASPRLCGEQK